MTDLLALDIATTEGVYYAYALYAGRQLLPCYIGIGKGDRLDHHMRVVRRGDSKRGNLRKFRTLYACWRKGITVRAVRLVYNLSLDQACAIERVLIAIYGRRDLGTGCLLNASGGGSGARLLAQSTRARLAEAGRRQMAKPEHRELMKTKRMTPEARARSSAAAKRRPPPSSESRAKMAAARHRANAENPAEMARRASYIRPGKSGYRHTEEAKKAIAAALRKSWKDHPTARANCTAHFKTLEFLAAAQTSRIGRKPMLGRKHPPNILAKMSAAQKARRAKERVGVST